MKLLFEYLTLFGITGKVSEEVWGQEGGAAPAGPEQAVTGPPLCPIDLLRPEPGTGPGLLHGGDL